MNRETQGREIRKLGGTPGFVVGCVRAVTGDGQVLIASSTDSQIGPYVSGAGKLIWTAGTQKLVKDIDKSLQRIEEYGMPARRAAYAAALQDEHRNQQYIDRAA